MSSLLQDLRHGLRLLARAPGFTAVALAALAIGVGANTAIFTVVNTLLLQPLPYRDAGRLAIVWEHNLPRDRRNNVVSPGNFLHWREMNQVFEDVAAVGLTFNITITGTEQPEDLALQLVSAQLFPILGVPPSIGRWFAAEEDRPGSRVAMISDRLWKRRFGGQPGLLDRPITLDGQPYTVVGVMPPGFSFLDRTVDIWLPIGFPAEARTARGRWLAVVGRLKPGVSLAAAQQDMERVAGELTHLFPAFNTGWTARVVPLREQLTGDVRPALLVLLGAVACVLLIACANVGTLLLARATSRQRELAVRAALGADRRRLLGQLLAESLVLATAGGLIGLLLAWWALGALRTVVADRLPVQRLEAVAIDGTVLLFTLAATVLSGILFGVIPALSAAGSSFNEALKEGVKAAGAARGNRTRGAFVVAQVALALVLLVGAGLLLRSFVRLRGVHPGFDEGRTITMRVSLPDARYDDDARRVQFFARLLERVETLPGVHAAGAISFLPLHGLGAATSYEVVGQPKPARGEEPVADVRVVAHDFFEAMGIPLVRGRLFRPQDAADIAGRVVINETMARRHWPGQDPIGRRVRISWRDNRADEIIGVVGDVRLSSLGTEPRATTYWPHARNAYGTMHLTVRSSGDPRAVMNAVATLVRQQDPGLAVANMRTMDEVLDLSVAQQRLTMLLLALFAGTALVLAGVGIYGVIAYNVTQRTREIGIRMALGAQRGQVLRLVVGQAARLAAIGILLGTIAAGVFTRSMSGLLFEVRPGDPAVYLAVGSGLAAVALLASYIPGRRATRVDPVIALRAE